MARADPGRRESIQSYSRDPLRSHGLRNADVHAIARDNWRSIKVLGKEEAFAICEELLSSGYVEETLVACDWCPCLRRSFLPDDLRTFQRWIGSYLDNWIAVDSFCNHTVGDIVVMYPDLVEDVVGWARSPNRWLRRASAVSLIVPARKGEFLKEAFRIADILLDDRDDMVQKGYGWLLKEEARVHEDDVFRYVIGNSTRMGRIALRYAIERMPPARRREAMGKVP